MRVKTPNLGKVYLNLCPGWCLTHNNAHHDNGRIVIGWCPCSFHVNILSMSSQFIHCEVKPTQGGKGFFCTFVYGFNEISSRGALWDGIREIAKKVEGGWVLMGDFNDLSSVDDRIGSTVRVAEIRPMMDCLNECGLTDVKASGKYFTWTNKQEGTARVFSRIDRVIANSIWLDSFDQAAVTFLPEGDFDHTPVVLRVYEVPLIKRPFKFCMWCYYSSMMDAVKEAWRQPVQGCHMYQVVEKLKRVKGVLRTLKKQGFGEAERDLIQATEEFTMIQDKLHENPGNIECIEQERIVRGKVQRAKKCVQAMLQQQAKLNWLKCGDENTRIFYQAIKARRRQNRIHAIHNEQGESVETHEKVSTAFLEYNKNLFTGKEQQQVVLSTLIERGKSITEEHKRIIMCPVTKEDVRRVMFSIPDDKAPGADGFNSCFYKKCWEIVGD
ncbi:uncharacterized protein LOC125492899 [Beta vulgaris subsp. vulgaris]|uniref:uncharacterized protein LOC125492899 n=1 Tax=Beta vulgaris subsp. vulgaris TaxID=3555 RepID=UPI0020375A31|nr:uncharacterized protein LOC125492899 [Beta vulgaris subsp. vulgaris]